MNSKGLQDIPERDMVHGVKGSLEVDEGNVEVQSFLNSRDLSMIRWRAEMSASGGR